MIKEDDVNSQREIGCSSIEMKEEECKEVEKLLEEKIEVIFAACKRAIIILTRLHCAIKYNKTLEHMAERLRNERSFYDKTLRTFEDRVKLLNLETEEYRAQFNKAVQEQEVERTDCFQYNCFTIG